MYRPIDQIAYSNIMLMCYILFVLLLLKHKNSQLRVDNRRITKLYQWNDYSARTIVFRQRLFHATRLLSIATHPPLKLDSYVFIYICWQHIHIYTYTYTTITCVCKWSSGDEADVDIWYRYAYGMFSTGGFCVSHTDDPIGTAIHGVAVTQR